MATAKEMRDSVAENAFKTEPKEEVVEEKETVTTDEPPEMAQYYGKGPGTNYMNPDGDPYSYRVYDDGSIQIIGGPSGVGTVLTEGKMHGAIKDALLGAEASAEPTPEDAAEMERLSSPAPEVEMPEAAPEIEMPTPEIEEPDAAMASLEGTMPTYIADEEHLGQLREGFEESLPQEALAEQSELDAEQTLVDEDAARQEEEAGRQAEREEAAIGREQSGDVSGGLSKLYELAKRLLAEEEAQP